MAPTSISATSIETISTPFNGASYPVATKTHYEFPARDGMPAVSMTWYDGGKLPPLPKGLEASRAFEERYGYYLVGDSGVIYDPSEKCASPRLVPESRMREAKFPPKTIPRVPGGDPFQEWISACKGGPLPGSNFEYAAPLTEMVLLGCLATRFPKTDLKWDTKALKFTNNDKANAFVKRQYRKGFEVEGL